jgi:hypothetical protein
VAKQDAAVTFWMEVACYEMTILCRSVTDHVHLSENDFCYVIIFFKFSNQLLITIQEYIFTYNTIYFSKLNKNLFSQYILIFLMLVHSMHVSVPMTQDLICYVKYASICLSTLVFSIHRSQINK